MSPRRPVVAVASLLTALLLLAAPAAAHVTVNPSEAEQGGFAKLTFRAPNERDDASTTKVEVFFPEEQPLFSVTVKPVPGWTVNVERTELDEPVDVFGEPRTDAVSKITWEGGPVNPGEFQEFDVSAGPLPEADQMVFKAIQTYSSGEIVRWIEEPVEGEEEPEHPAPVLTLVAPGDGETPDTTPQTVPAADTDDDDADGTPVAVAALVVALIAAALGGAALVRGRR